MPKPTKIKTSRRAFVAGASASAIAAGTSLFLPSYSRANTRPGFTHGVQSGDVDMNSGMAWVRADRPSSVAFEVSTSGDFKNAVKLPPLNALPETDYAVKRLLSDLPSDQNIHWRAVATDLNDINARSEPIVGSFKTAPASRRSVKFVWSGDTAGQGWGIDEARGGMKTYATMAKHDPDFFIHSGDTIYADGPLKTEVALKDGSIWKNIVTPEKSKVAETLTEFRGQWKYNMLDANLKAFNAKVPTFFQWDDHEVVNNWSSSKDLTADDRYSEKNIHVLAARAGRAFHEMTPIRFQPKEPGRVYRTINYGPHLDIFFLDLRSYRAANDDLQQETPGDATRLMGAQQIAWLKRELANSRATWKVIASDMPLGLVVWDGPRAEAVSNGKGGAPKGREHEFADLLRYIKSAGISNTVWLTADVHYTAAHYYNPNKAAFQDFEPFWEFVTGPLHAGTYGPNDIDATFGPEVKFVKAPTSEQGGNLPPSDGLQFFGVAEIEGKTGVLTVKLMDSADTELWKVSLEPRQRA